MNDEPNYDINFFTPRTPFLKDNIRLIVISITVWAVFTFGFQILLRVIETPTPQPDFIAFETGYPALRDGTATREEKVALARAYLSLISKATPVPADPPLKQIFTATTYHLLPEEQRAAWRAAAADSTPRTTADVAFAEEALGIQDDVVLRALLPFALAPIEGDREEMFNPNLASLMETYFIHNRSVLTDTRVLGFPFHYVYSAVFLLALFNLICLVYCYLIDGIMKKHGMESANE